MINEKDGKEVCAIVKLKTKINGHKATIAEDYRDLKEIVMDKRREVLLEMDSEQAKTHLCTHQRKLAEV